jgi:RNA polymerase sigma-70 factor (ECF subfamily)
MDDNELVTACLRGEKEAFRRIMEAHSGPALALALNILANRQDAEDACQEAFVKAYRNLARFDGRANFRTWLLTIVYRRCLDMLKRKRRFRAAVEKAGHDARPGRGREAGSTSAGGDGQRLPVRWLGGLTPRERTALCLWADEDLTAVEIAEVLGCAASTARVTLFNARRKLKSSLEKAHAAS